MKKCSGRDNPNSSLAAVPVPSSTGQDRPSFLIPPGRLSGTSFYWYEREPDLLEAEIEAMNHYFPHFRMVKLEDGRLCWIGTMEPGEIEWTLQAIYDHTHPHNNSYGGSIKIYSIEPDLNELAQASGTNIPHTLRDSSGSLFMCTARPGDVVANSSLVTSAASALTWAAKWIWTFEAYVHGTITYEQFSSHSF